MHLSSAAPQRFPVQGSAGGSERDEEEGEVPGLLRGSNIRREGVEPSRAVDEPGIERGITLTLGPKMFDSSVDSSNCR